VIHGEPIHVLRLDGRGGGEPVSLDEAPAAARPPEGRAQAANPFDWIHLNREDADAARWLREESGLDEEAAGALLAEDTRPRCDAHGEGVILILRGVNLQEGAAPEDMVSVRLWIDGARVIGVWARPLHAVEDILQGVRRGAGPLTPGDFAARLSQRIADRMEPTVTALEEGLDDLEDVLLGESGHKSGRSQLAALRRRAIRLRRYIGPQRDALTTFQIEDFGWLADRDRSRLREAANRTMRLHEGLEAVRERAAVLHDELSELRTERMSRYMLLFSVVASIFIPLTLLTGLLGVNLAGIPFAEEVWAFAAFTGLLVLTGGVSALLFRRFGLL